jgi:hypothetical protein
MQSEIPIAWIVNLYAVKLVINIACEFICFLFELNILLCRFNNS